MTTSNFQLVPLLELRGAGDGPEFFAAAAECARRGWRVLMHYKPEFAKQVSAVNAQAIEPPLSLPEDLDEDTRNTLNGAMVLLSCGWQVRLTVDVEQGQYIYMQMTPGEVIH